jgi:hypothetical protein
VSGCCIVDLLLELLATRKAHCRKFPGSSACFFLPSKKNAAGTLDAGKDLRLAWQKHIDTLSASCYNVSMEVINMALQRLVCNIDETLMEQLDEYAASLHITRTAAVAVLLSTALQAQKSMNTLEELMKAYKAEKAAQ